MLAAIVAVSHDRATPKAFSSEVGTGSREETASNQESRAPFRFNRNGKALVSVKPVKQRFCFANVGNLKALCECPVHRFKDLPCVGIPVLPDPETRKA